jgi:hypothetical protein
MTTLRTYGNLAEAGFAKSLLESAGIRAELADEHSYGIGYGPVVSELRLQVDEMDLDRAREVLDKGPDVPQPPREVVSPDEMSRLAKRGSRFPAGIFIALAVGFLALLFAVSQFREKQRKQADSHTTFTFDRNGDGKPDEWRVYDSRGAPFATKCDDNFDGKVDAWYDFKNGAAKSGRMDTDFNGVPDLFVEYKNELPVRSEYKPNGSKTASRVETFVNGILTEAIVDSDRDGTPDYRIKYDAFANPSEHLPIQP